MGMACVVRCAYGPFVFFRPGGFGDNGLNEGSTKDLQHPGISEDPTMHITLPVRSECSHSVSYGFHRGF